MWTPLHRWKHLRGRRTSGGSGGGGGASATSAGASSSAITTSSNASVQVSGGNGPTLFDDTAIGEGRNGQPASGALFARLIKLANQIAYSGKPAYSWIGGISTGFSTFEDPTPWFRAMYNGANYGAVTEGAQIQYEQLSGFAAIANQGWATRVNDVNFVNSLNYSTPVVGSYPTSLLRDTMVGTRGYTAANSEIAVWGKTSNYPVMRSGVVWQEPQDVIDPNVAGSYVDSSGTQTGVNAYVGSQLVRAGGPIVGIRSDNLTAADVLQKLRIQLLNTHQYHRGQQCWSAQLPDTNAITFSTSKNQFRYIFDQTYGTGGTAFAADSPGTTTIFGTTYSPAITMPLKYAGSNLYTQIRVYVFVYAAMTGGTDTGSIGVANKDSGGTMAATPSAVTNPVTISGTTLKWYPDKVSSSTASLPLTTAPYFKGYCGTFSEFDRIGLCFKSSGTTDSVKVAAFALIPVGAPF